MFEFDFLAGIFIISLLWLWSLLHFLRINKKKRKDTEAVSDDKLDLAKMFLGISSFIAVVLLIGTIGFMFCVVIGLPLLWIICLICFLKMRKKKRIDPKIVEEDRFFEDKYALAGLFLGITSFIMFFYILCVIGLIVLSYLPISFM